MICQQGQGQLVHLPPVYPAIFQVGSSSQQLISFLYNTVLPDTLCGDFRPLSRTVFEVALRHVFTNLETAVQERGDQHVEARR